MSALFITYQHALKDYGEPRDGSLLSASALEAHRGRIPGSFLEFIADRPLGKWLQGYFQFCNPDDYQSVLTLILEGDKELNPERTHMLGFSALGNILAWNEDYRTVKINLVYGRVICPKLFAPEHDADDDITLGIAIGNINASSYDCPDEDGKPMFKRLLRAHGELDVGQIYAPRLHPALGGRITVDEFHRVNALAAMTIAAQATSFSLYDPTKPGVPMVRKVGN